jgi:hypothetical protein
MPPAGALRRHLERGLEALFETVWKVEFCPQGHQMDSQESGRAPTGNRGAVEESWDNCGAKLTHYRDYIMRHVPQISGSQTVWMDGFDGRWGATIPLPANPETMSRARSNPTRKIDALSYCHGVATELVRLAEYLLAQPVVSAYIANPPKHAPPRRELR